MATIVIMGPPGSGKGTQAKKIAENFGYHHFSTGEALRQEVAANSELGKLAQKTMENGGLVSNFLIFQIIDKLEGDKIIFDGYPRNLIQTEHFFLFCKRKKCQIKVISLKTDQMLLLARMLNRAKIENRSDDNPDTIQKRLDVYEQETAPILEYFQKQGILHEVDGNGTIEEVFDRIKPLIK